MKTVLCAWEIGAGFGHAATLKALGDRIRLLAGEAGVEFRIVYALSEAIHTRSLFGDKARVIPAPFLQNPIHLLSHTGSYTDMLTACGFAQEETLEALAGAWENIFDLVEPDLVIAEASPAARLAAPEGVPVVITGNGFYAPPVALKSYPPLRSGAASSFGEGRVLDIVNTVQRRRGRAELARLPQLGQCDYRAVFTLPQLDPYSSVRTEPVLGHYIEGLEPTPPPEKPSIFYYGTTSAADTEAISTALMEVGVPVSCYIRGRQTAAAQFFRLQGATVYDSPPDLRHVIGASSLVVSHGTGGLTHAAMMVGRPHLMIPGAFEPLLNARRAQALGVGKMIDLTKIDTEIENTTLKDSILEALSSDDLAETAFAHARYIKTLPLPVSPLGTAAEASLNLLGIGASP